MVVLGVSAALDVPVLDGPDDVGLVRRPELDLNLVASVALSVIEQEIKASSMGLTASDRPQ
jgi:hypothetical protein